MHSHSFNHSTIYRESELWLRPVGLHWLLKWFHKNKKKELHKFDHSIETNCITLIKCTISAFQRFTICHSSSNSCTSLAKTETPLVDLVSVFCFTNDALNSQPPLKCLCNFFYLSMAKLCIEIAWQHIANIRRKRTVVVRKVGQNNFVYLSSVFFLSKNARHE